MDQPEALRHELERRETRGVVGGAVSKLRLGVETAAQGGVWPQGRVISSKPVRGNVSELITTDPTDLPALGLAAERWRDESASTRMVSHEEGLNTQPASLMSNLMRPWQGLCLPLRRYLRCDWLWRGRVVWGTGGGTGGGSARIWGVYGFSSAARLVRLGRRARWILEKAPTATSCFVWRDVAVFTPLLTL